MFESIGAIFNLSGMDVGIMTSVYLAIIMSVCTVVLFKIVLKLFGFSL